MSDSITRLVHPEIDTDYQIMWQSMLSHESIKVYARVIVPAEEVIPVVFLPGVMGTKLVSKSHPDNHVWAPPESMGEKLGAVMRYWSKTPSLRQAEFNPENTMVDYDSEPTGEFPNVAIQLSASDLHGSTPQEKAKDRGWGQIYGSCYLPIMAVLEQQLNYLFDAQDPPPNSTLLDRLTPMWKDVLDKQTMSVYVRQIERNFYGNPMKPLETGDPGRAFGAQKAFRPLAIDDLEKLALRAYFPVHAIGYNWTQSNELSAATVVKEINRIMEFYKQVKRNESDHMKCEKVIIVTHSMGGIVARLAAQINADIILGVSHGVMPATGAPATYKRFRSGFNQHEVSLWHFLERLLVWAQAKILGRDAKDCAGELAFAPGPMELLPMPDYDATLETGLTEKHWLQVAREDHNGRLIYENLGNADFVGSIYAAEDETNWWRMIKKHLLNPSRKDLDRAKAEADYRAKVLAEALQGGNEKKIAQAEQENKDAQKNYELIRLAAGENITGDEETDEANDFQRFKKIIKKVRETQEKLKGSYHPNTYAHYEASDKLNSWARVVWKYKEPINDWEGQNYSYSSYNLPDNKLSDPESDDPKHRHHQDNFEGDIAFNARGKKHRFSLDLPRDPGDGTVPACSGAAATPYCVQIFKHGNEALGHKPYIHQDSYLSELCRDVTLYSIARMVADDTKR
ncbi:MAG: GPI inositol-deacylase [Burkholderiales bacterium]|jgi:pimeloyl-ACP methyl ester carboxylesterase|nr:GPI inositol-deacylase [Burkholderiales bacterium]